MRLLQLTTIENDSTAQITVAERDKFKALWMPEGAYISLTKELNEKLSAEKVVQILPQIALLGMDTSSEIAIAKSELPFAVNLVANSKGFPILHYDPTSPETDDNIVAVSIYLKPEEVVEKIFVHNNVKLRFYRVMDDKPNFASLLLQLEERDNTTPQFTVVISSGGVQTMAYEVYSDKIITAKRVFALRKEGQQLRLRVDYLVPKTAPKKVTPITSEFRKPSNTIHKPSPRKNDTFRPSGFSPKAMDSIKASVGATPNLDTLLEKFQKDAVDRERGTKQKSRDKYKNKR